MLALSHELKGDSNTHPLYARKTKGKGGVNPGTTRQTQKHAPEPRPVYPQVIHQRTRHDEVRKRSRAQRSPDVRLSERDVMLAYTDHITEPQTRTLSVIGSVSRFLRMKLPAVVDASALKCGADHAGRGLTFE